MLSFDQVKWQSISHLPLIRSMIDGAFNDTRDHLQNLTEARGRSHVLDDATVDRAQFQSARAAGVPSWAGR